MITVSVAILDPDLTLFYRFCQTLKETAPLVKQLIVVDNASEDKSYRGILENLFPGEFEVIENAVNVGYGQAHNQAIHKATQPYFIVCNDDIEFFEENWSERMVQILKDPNVGQVGPINKVCNKWNGDCHGFGDPDTTDPDYIEGSLFMMRTELARRYGPFDSIYQYGYYEDGDLSLRLKKDGYVLKQIPINWEHHRAKTTNRIMLTTDVYGYQVLNRRIFESRWYSYVVAKKFGRVIVVKREGSFGDVFLTGPVLRKLRELYPNDALVLMSKLYEPILIPDCVDAVTPMHEPIYADIFIDLDYAYERDFENIHIVKAYEREARKQLNDPDFRTHGLTGTFRSLLDKFPGLGEILPTDFDKYICVDVGDTWHMKKWPDAYYYQLIKRLRSNGRKVALVGLNPGPTAFDFDLNFCSVMNIEQTVYLLREARLYVGHEGLLGHICQSLSKDCVLLYTCTKPEFTGDQLLPTLHVLRTKAVCHGCRHIGPVAGTTISCPRNYACTKMISVDDVFTKVMEVVG